MVVGGCWLVFGGSWLVVGCWLCWFLVVSCWWLVIGDWLLGIGCWLLVAVPLITNLATPLTTRSTRSTRSTCSTRSTRTTAPPTPPTPPAPPHHTHQPQSPPTLNQPTSLTTASALPPTTGVRVNKVRPSKKDRPLSDRGVSERAWTPAPQGLPTRPQTPMALWTGLQGIG